MTFPLYPSEAFGYPTAMALATLLGLGFGFVLERAGFGHATNLTAQFYGRDNRVLKVMFSAIVTATVGLGLLGGLGVVDLGALTVPGSYWVAHLVGGLLLGAGFVVSGYCPGTALVAAGSGNVDGLWSLAGVMAGALLFALGWPLVEGVYSAGDLGVLAFPELLGVSWSMVAAGVVAMAIGAFFGAELLERRLAVRDGTSPPDAGPRDRVQRNRVLAGFTVAALVGLGVSAVPASAEPERRVAETGSIEPLELAEVLVERPHAVWLVDLRDPGACAEARIAGALCLPEGDPEGSLLATLPPTRTLVLYGVGEVEAPRAASSYGGRVATLAGGYAAFAARVLAEPPLPGSPSRAQIEAWSRRSALHAHFTGVETVAAPPPPPRAVERKVKKGGGC